MVTNIRTLKRKAREAAESRGHLMGRFSSNVKGTSASSQCMHCHCFAHVNVRPQPNDIDIGGSAVALNCKQGE